MQDFPVVDSLQGNEIDGKRACRFSDAQTDVLLQRCSLPNTPAGGCFHASGLSKQITVDLIDDLKAMTDQERPGAVVREMLFADVRLSGSVSGQACETGSDPWLVLRRCWAHVLGAQARLINKKPLLSKRNECQLGPDIFRYRGDRI